MKHISIDIETKSSIDIGKAGLYKYAQSGDFEVLLFAYSADGAPVQIVDLACGEQIPDVSCITEGYLKTRTFSGHTTFSASFRRR